MASAEDQVAALFLSDIGAPQTPDNMRAVKIWLAAENSNPTLRNNPWNLHQGGACGQTGDFCPRTVLPGQIGVKNVGPGDQNVAVFSTLEAGVQANVNNLTYLSTSHPEYGYGSVISSIRSSDPVGFLTALGNSAWSAGRYRIDGQPGTNKLVKNFTGGSGVVNPGQTTPNGSTISTTSDNQQLAALLGKSVNDNLTEADLDKLAHMAVAQTGLPDPLGTSFAQVKSVLMATLSQHLNKPIKDISLDGISTIIRGLAAGNQNVTGGGNILNAGTGIFGNAQSAIIFLGVLLVGIVFIGTGGLISLRKDK